MADVSVTITDLSEVGSAVVTPRTIVVSSGTGEVGPQGPAGPTGATGATGPTGATGADGTDGQDGADGVGVPVGGTTGQVLAKASVTDFDTEWVDQTGGGGGGTVDSIVEGTGIGVDSTDPANPIVSNTGATAAQGALADSAVQPADLATVATTGAYADLTGKPTIPDSADDIGAVPTTRTVNGHALSADVTVTKSDVSLGSVDNTADAAKAVLSATKLTTARAINGVSFDGSADITVADSTKVPTTRTVAGHALSADVSLVKGDVGLGNVDNTADTAKPVSTAQQTALDLKANLASPALTGNPTAPTPSAADNDTSIATTAFVQGEISAKAPLASPTFTGNPAAPTPTAGDNDTSIATTAFVTTAVAKQPEVFMVALGDETTAITTGTAKVTLRMPFAFTLTAVRASLTTASSSGIPTVDINEGGTTILSTKLTIDASELTSTTAATAAVISDSSLADDAEITFDIDVAGTGAKGLKVYLIGTRT